MDEYIIKWLGIKKTYYHSFDCATKTLGVYCGVIVDSDNLNKLVLNKIIMELITLHKIIRNPINKIKDYKIILEMINRVKKYYKAIKYLFNHNINSLYYDTWDISHNMENRRDIERAALNLKTNLNCLISKIGYPQHMLYEYQMSDNDKSRTISHYLIYHYSGCSNIIKRGAIYKNKVYYSNLLYQNYLQNITDPYKARKKHCEDNFKYWCIINKMNYTKFGNKLDDIGDAFMQLIAYINNIGL